MRRSLLGSLLLCALTGCTSFVPRAESPTTVAPRDFPRSVRLVLADSTRIRLFHARLEADTIRGEVANGTATKVATKDVVRWDARRFDSEGTALLTLVTFVAGRIAWEILKPDIVYTAGAAVR